ncbi:MAG: nucleotidyltransferase family protein [Bacteroidales bacterium]|jgi:hypothetical protein|nr:nucleotidyltransferase family protein [Bacteroidales bacterium]
MQNAIAIGNIDFVKNTLFINHFCKILSLCGENCLIVPLKGISLLFSIYKDNYSRDVSDIDILVPENNVEDLIVQLKKLGYVFRNQNINNRKQIKRKFDMMHADKKYCDLDIHTDLINKKFYRTSTGNFTAFAWQRLTKTTYNHQRIFLLSPVDEWLYLAQHYCFHLFSNDKWLRDLYLLQYCFSYEEITELVALAKQFHFERVVTMVGRYLKNKYSPEAIKIPEMITKKYFVFDLLSRKPGKKFAYTFSNRIIAIYWEFVFIDNPLSRLKAYLQLLFPALTIFMDIYNCKSKISCCFYPLHLAGVLLSSILFLPVLCGKIFLVFNHKIVKK